MEIIEKYTEKKEILNLKFKDDLGYSDLNINEFKDLDFDNKLIEKVSIYVISSYESNFENKLTFTYYGTDFDSDIVYSSNNKDQFLNIKDDIEKWNISVTSRKWIPFIFKWYFYAFVFFVICVSLSAFIYKFIYLMNVESAIVAVFLIIQSIFWILTMPCVQMIRQSFPKVELDIGVNKHKKTRNFLWIVISLIIIPFIMSLLIK
ncbi:MAG: hypothetical protein IJV94_04560 [Bacilli bacterium]|nr:hypothetical protein [Bacilli bacterium]